MNFAVLASGNGSNLQAIIDAKAKIKADLMLVITDRAEAKALERAKKAQVKAVCLRPKEFADREAYDGALVAELQRAKIDFVVLAGYMRILTPVFVNAYRGKILNVHPSLLPAFAGAHGIRDAYEYGVRFTGVTIHFVDEHLDGGPIIAQEVIKITPKDSLKLLEDKIHRIEHELYPRVIDMYARGKLRVEGRKVYIT